MAKKPFRAEQIIGKLRETYYLQWSLFVWPTLVGLALLQSLV